MVDEAGDFVSWSDFDSYGNRIGSTPPDAGLPAYAGRFYLSTLGIYENRRRFYDPSLGRFTQQDPVGFAAGDTNLYAYVGNNPLLFTDPNGTTAAVTYGELVDMIAMYTGALCNLGNCVGNLWKGVVEATVNHTPVDPAGDPASCAASFLPINNDVRSYRRHRRLGDTTGNFTNIMGGLGAAVLGEFGSQRPSAAAGPLGNGIAILGAVDGCLKMTFTVQGLTRVIRQKIRRHTRKLSSLKQNRQRSAVRFRS